MKHLVIISTIIVILASAGYLIWNRNESRSESNSAYCSQLTEEACTADDRCELRVVCEICPAIGCYSKDSPRDFEGTPHVERTDSEKAIIAKEAEKIYCSNFSYDNCPQHRCVVGPSCSECLDIRCHHIGYEEEWE